MFLTRQVEPIIGIIIVVIDYLIEIKKNRLSINIMKKENRKYLCPEKGWCPLFDSAKNNFSIISFL